VYLGRLKLTQLIKQAYLTEEEGMDSDKLLARIAALEGELQTLKAGTAAAPPAPADAELAKEGLAYRAWLRDDTIRLAKIARCEKEAQWLLDAAPNAPAARLIELRDGYQKKVDELFPPTGAGSLTNADPGRITEDEPPAERPRRGVTLT
jgi:hypothetical protein